MRGHMLDRRRGQRQRHPYVDVHQFVEPLNPVGIVLPGLGGQDAGAMRHRVDALAAEQFGDEAVGGQVPGRLNAAGLHPLHVGTHAGQGCQVVDDHLGAELCQRDGGRPADAVRRAGHKNAATLQAER